jgi:hypothetical protein
MSAASNAVNLPGACTHNSPHTHLNSCINDLQRHSWCSHLCCCYFTPCCLVADPAAQHSTMGTASRMVSTGTQQQQLHNSRPKDMNETHTAAFTPCSLGFCSTPGQSVWVHRTVVNVSSRYCYCYSPDRYLADTVTVTVPNHVTVTVSASTPTPGTHLSSACDALSTSSRAPSSATRWRASTSRRPPWHT